MKLESSKIGTQGAASKNLGSCGSRVPSVPFYFYMCLNKPADRLFTDTSARFSVVRNLRGLRRSPRRLGFSLLLIAALDEAAEPTKPRT